jgi:hypothetical protein
MHRCKLPILTSGKGGKEKYTFLFTKLKKKLNSLILYHRRSDFSIAFQFGEGEGIFHHWRTLIHCVVLNNTLLCIFFEKIYVPCLMGSHFYMSQGSIQFTRAEGWIMCIMCSCTWTQDALNTDLVCRNIHLSLCLYGISDVIMWIGYPSSLLVNMVLWETFPDDKCRELEARCTSPQHDCTSS